MQQRLFPIINSSCGEMHTYFTAWIKAWNTPPIGETRTSPAPPPSYTLEEIAGGEPGTGKQISFTLSEQEIPAGILP